MFTAAPVIETLSSDIEIIVNESITIQCISFGFPRPTISWSHNEVTLEENDMFLDVNRFVIDDITVGSILTRRNTQPRSAGIYSCEVINIVGNTNKAVKVTVIGKNIILVI